jgi:uncharacterized repeat protein (TIGR03803 family)
VEGKDIRHRWAVIFAEILVYAQGRCYPVSPRENLPLSQRYTLVSAYKGKVWRSPFPRLNSNVCCPSRSVRPIPFAGVHLMASARKFGILRFLKMTLRLASVGLFATLAGQAQTYTIVHSFAGKPNDGAFANGEVTQDSAGNFYGTTEEGGTDEDGSVFKMDAGGEVTILYSFTDGSDGRAPQAGLLLDTQDNLYGTTQEAVFRLSPENDAFKTIHMFGIGNDGGGTRSRMVTNKGDLYFVTPGADGDVCSDLGDCGRILKMTKGGTETVLYAFTGGADGAIPEGLVRDSAGNLYGVALTNVTAQGAGTVFKLDTAGVFTVLYTFTGGADGGTPVGRLTIDANGNLHGVTRSGGDPTCNCGVVFRLDSSGHETVVHKFFGGGGGSVPLVGLLDVGGVLYGTTAGGGDVACSGGCGVLYEISKAGKYTVLHRFGGLAGNDGAGSISGALTLGSDGSIYGATYSGGISCTENNQGCGTIFKYTP